jgi:NitT/TauT family transport system permease protein
MSDARGSRLVSQPTSQTRAPELKSPFVKAPNGRARLRLHLRKYTRIYMPVFTLALLATVWELSVAALDIPRFILPPPSSIAEAAVADIDLIWQHTLVTGYETLVGFALAVVVSLPLAVMIVYSRLLRDALFPLILLTQAVPKVAVAPILLLALGYGEAPKIVVAFLVCFFPIVINAAAGLGSVPEERLLLARSMSASEFDTFRKIRFPSALPMIFVGLKLGVTLAVIGAVIGEFVGSDEGLGYLILISTVYARTSLAFAAMVGLALMSILLFYVIAWIERLTIPWAEAEE